MRSSAPRWIDPVCGLAAACATAACVAPAEALESYERVPFFGAVASIAATLALIHLLLFAFESRDRRNLYFAIQAAAFAIVAFLDYRERLDDPVIVPELGDLQRWAVSALILAIARFAYSLFGDRAPRRFVLYAAAIGLLLAISIPRPDLFGAPAGVLGLVVIADTLLTGILGWRRLGEDVWIVATGATLFAFGGLTQLGLDLAGRTELADRLMAYLWGGLALLVASSVFLARTLARTRRELEERLVEVEGLTAKTLAQERAAREEAIRRRLLDAENERRGRELEEARRLQLAMLPEELPRRSGFEVAARMRTATEVGGDFYDASLDANGDLWLVVGDAVGHGARAGTLVAVAKGLHAGLTGIDTPAAALARFDRALRRIGLRRAHLAMVVGRLAGDTLELAAAGMPPVLVRRASGEVEEVEIASLPLGAPLSQSYEGRRLSLAPGELVLLLTDGLVELPGADGGPAGYAAVRRALESEPPSPGEPLADWVERFIEHQVGAVPPPDDVTLLALRRERD